MVAQVIHAAGESSNRVPKGTHAIALGVPNEAALHDVESRLTELGLAHTVIVESDAPYSGQRTAIGIEPTCCRSTVRKVVSSLALIR